MIKLNEEKSNIEIVKDIIKQNMSQHNLHVKRCKEAERYYKCENDILRTGVQKDGKDPLRNADNRIPRNFHGLLVNQKSAYMFTAPPLFDLGKGREEDNKKVAEILGDKYAKACKDLCVNASNKECAWLHYWENEGNFKYAVVDSEQIIPVYSDGLEKELTTVMRTYRDKDFETGKTIVIWEYWDKKYCYSYKKKIKASNVNIEPNLEFQYTISDDQYEYRNVYEHGMEQIPFIPFYNNNVGTNDLKNIKALIDAYDKVYSGFLNDLEDVQEVIFVLTNYGGEDLNEFLSDLKKYKAIKVNSDNDDGNPDGGNSKGGVETLTISIPIEAREKFLEITRKAIFEQGQGVDPDPQRFGNPSGEALKYLYSLLEQKAGLMETEFKLGFGELVRAICRFSGIECGQIIQTWTRTAIRSDSEQADICAKSVGVVSNKTILKNHPIVENADEEEKQIEKERQDELKRMDGIYPAFKKREEDGDDVDDEPEE